MRTAPLFRWSGRYWGFTAGERIYDRYGRNVGWLLGADVYSLSGGFIGEMRDRHYALRNTLRAQPVQRAARPAIPYLCPPAVEPDRGPRDPVNGWTDALPWPLAPPEPPTV